MLTKVFSNVDKGVFKRLAKGFQTFGNNLWNVAQNCYEMSRTFIANYP